MASSVQPWKRKEVLVGGRRRGGKRRVYHVGTFGDDANTSFDEGLSFLL
jgi:hypothetical protein